MNVNGLTHRLIALLATALVAAAAVVVAISVDQVEQAHAVTAGATDDEGEGENEGKDEDEDENRDDDDEREEGEPTPDEEPADDPIDEGVTQEDDATAEARRQRAERLARRRELRRKRRRARRERRAGLIDLQPPATPERGESLNLEPESGDVEVTLPDDEEPVPLEEAASLPVGSIVDATEGAVTLTAAASPSGGTQRATFSGASFQVVQPRTAGFTTIRLRNPSPASCRRSRTSVFSPAYSPLATASAARKVRRLWGRGKGRFQTRGSHGVATVRGTTWMTANTCKGTLVRVKHGVVEVRDFGRRKTVVVRAGKQYLAKKRPARKRR